MDETRWSPVRAAPVRFFTCSDGLRITGVDAGPEKETGVPTGVHISPWLLHLGNSSVCLCKLEVRVNFSVWAYQTKRCAST